MNLVTVLIVGGEKYVNTRHIKINSGPTFNKSVNYHRNHFKIGNLLARNWLTMQY